MSQMPQLGRLPLILFSLVSIQGPVDWAQWTIALFCLDLPGPFHSVFQWVERAMLCKGQCMFPVGRVLTDKYEILLFKSSEV